MFKKILCPVDFSKTSMYAAENAIKFAIENKSEITFIHVMDVQALQGVSDLSIGGIDDMRVLMEEEKPLLRKLKEKCDEAKIKVKTIMTHGDPVGGILDALNKGDYDLVIMGTKGKSGLTRLVVGSIAEAVLRRSDRPVLLYNSKS